MLFNDPRIVFIHIPKTAGSSLEHFLIRSQNVSQRDGKLGQHATLQDAHNIYGSEIYNYKIFTVVRNTWDRIISYYLMCYRRRSFTEIGLKEHYIDFPTFYKLLTPDTRHCQNIFHYLSIDGVIPDNITYLEFSDITNSFTEYWTNLGFNMHEEFPHYNHNNEASDALRNYLRSDPNFIKAVFELYNDEIEFLRSIGKLQERDEVSADD